MNGGRIEQIGSPIEVYERPETLFVAGFIGSPPINLLPLTDGVGLDGLGALPQGTDLIGVRPDAITLTRPDAPALSLRGEIELIEPVGGESHVHLRIDGIENALIASIAGRAPVGETETVTCYARLDQLHPFNSETGRRTD
jgi:sn-glycerol 3-phosphate transport system ATP-binding protein